MANTKFGRALEGKSSVYSKALEGFVGVDSSADPAAISERRMAYSINMWRDYESENGGAIETIPGWRQIFRDEPLSGRSIHGLFCFRGMSGAEYLIIHRQTNLYRFPLTDIDKNGYIGDYLIYSGMTEKESVFFDSGGKCYILDGEHFLCVGESGDVQTVSDTAYVPTTFVNGEPYEQRNMLTNKFIERVPIDASNSGDGGSSAPNTATGERRIYTVYDPFEEITAVKLNGVEDITFTADGENGTVEVLVLPEYRDRELYIYGNGVPNKFAELGGAKDVYGGTNMSYGTAKTAIEKCTISCAFDGRVFLTGNPDLPNTVFFSGRSLSGMNDPSYFGIYNYFNDGIGNVPNTAMTANASMLAIFKGAASSEASVYYHTGQYNTDPATQDIIPRIYPSTEGATGIPCIGAACNFADDMVFLSPNGLEGVGKQLLNLERTLTHRSARIDSVFRQYLSGVARLAEWKGYLCVLASEGRMFLADSRAVTVNESTGEKQYEWFMLDGVGSYSGDPTKNEFMTGTIALIKDGKRFDVLLGDETTVNVQLGSVVGQEELSGSFPLVSGGGHPSRSAQVRFSYIRKGGVMYQVDNNVQDLWCCYLPEEGVFCPLVSTDEKYGGYFNPATVLTEYNGRLFFGTDDGSVCIFNTDKRGKAVSVGGTTSEEPVGTDEIHSKWYDRCGHRYHSGMATLSDNCGYPQLAKSTVGKTLTVKAKRMRNSAFTLSVRSDREDWKYVEDFTLSENSFYQVDFANMSFEDGPRTILASDEKLKRWCEKQLYLFSDGFRRPFGVYGLSYCYTLAGRVRGR